MARTRQQYYADNVGLKKDGREFYLNDELLAKLENVPNVIDNVTSTSATDALSANMGRVLQDQINQLASVGTFLSLWDCTTGLPETDPAVNPYQYKTGDYYIVSKIAEEGEDNYRPRGTQYDVGIASTVVETEDIQVGDWYLYDGAKWIKQDNTGKEYPIDDALSPTSTNAVENRVVTEALNKLNNLKVLPMPHLGDELDGIMEFIMGGGRVVYYKEGENDDIYFYEVVHCDGWMITAYCHDNYEYYTLETDEGETYDAISNDTLKPVLYNDYKPTKLTASLAGNTITRLTSQFDVTSTSTQDTYNLKINAPRGTIHVVKLNSYKDSDVEFIPTDGLTNPYGFDLTLKAGKTKTLLVVGTDSLDDTKGEIIYATDQEAKGGDVNMKVFPLPQEGDDITEIEEWIRGGNAVTFLEDMGAGEQYFRDVYYSDLESGLLFTETNEGYFKQIAFDTGSMEVTDVENISDRPIKYDDLYWDGPNSGTTLSGKFGSKRFYNKNTTLTAGTSTRYPSALYIAEIRNSHATNNITVSLGAGINNPYNISIELKPGEKKHLLLVGEENKQLTAVHLMGAKEEDNVLVVEEPNVGDDIAEILEAIRGGRQVVFYMEDEDGNARYSPVDALYEEDAYFDTYNADFYKIYGFNGTEVTYKDELPNPYIKRRDYNSSWLAGFGRYNVVTADYTLNYSDEGNPVEGGMIYVATIYNNANNPITVSLGNKIRNPEGATVKIDSKKEATMFFRGYNGQLTYLCAVNGEDTNNIYSIPQVGDDISDMIAKARNNKRVILTDSLEGNTGTQIYYLDSVDEDNLFLNFYKLSGGGWMIEFDDNGEVVTSDAIPDGNMKYDDYRVRQREEIKSFRDRFSTKDSAFTINIADGYTLKEGQFYVYTLHNDGENDVPVTLGNNIIGDGDTVEAGGRKDFIFYATKGNTSGTVMLKRVDGGKVNPATDTTYGTVKLNSEKGITLNNDGVLEINGRRGQFPNTTGLYAPDNREPRNVDDYSVLVTDAKGMSIGNRALGIVSGVGINVRSAAPGTTVYYAENTYLNRIIAKTCENGFVSKDEATSKVEMTIPVVSVLINGQTFTPDSSPDDPSNPIVITLESSANPDTTITQLRMFGKMGSYSTAHIGNGVHSESGGRHLLVGGAITKEGNGNDNCIVGMQMYSNGNGNAMFGRNHIAAKNRSFLAGTGHDTTNAMTEGASALGQYSLLDSYTLFAVGNGTSATDRKNAFEVNIKNGGTAKVNFLEANNGKFEFANTLDIAPAITTANWTPGNGGSIVDYEGTPGFATTDVRGTTVNITANTGVVKPVIAGDTLTWSFKARKKTGSETGKLQLNLLKCNATGGSTSNNIVKDGTAASYTTEWTEYTGTFTVPSGMEYVRPRFTRTNTGNGSTGGYEIKEFTLIQSVDSGIVLTSPNGTKYKLGVDDSGVLTTTAI